MLLEEEPTSFSEYLSQCYSLIKNRRSLGEKQNIDTIIDNNMPFNLSPHIDQKIKYGALLTHGLLDSPFTLKDIAKHLQAKGILSRAILLPGHGTRPDDLLNVTYKDWIKTVQFGVDTLKKEVDKIYLIGYSTGAALSIHHALKDPTIAGILLIAPAIKINISADILAAFQYLKKQLTPRKDWIYIEDETDFARYKSIAFNPVKQVHELLEVNQQLLNKQSLPCPVHITMSEDDETVSSTATLEFFEKDYHALSKFILYSTKMRSFKDARIIMRNSHYALDNIKNFSHIGIPFSPDNPHYGMQGDSLQTSDTDKIFYGAYHHYEKKIHNKLFELGLIKSRKHTLTYNPDFDFMMQSMVNFILH